MTFLLKYICGMIVNVKGAFKFTYTDTEGPDAPEAREAEVCSDILLQTLFSEDHPKVYNADLQQHYLEIFTQMRFAYYEIFGD